MDNDALTEIPANVSTIVDLLESKGITWAEYQEGLPFTGFTGFDFPDPDGANKYVRKHKWVVRLAISIMKILTLLRSPLIIYNSTTDIPERMANIKNFTLFAQDLENNKLPQWMFITPNMSKFFCVFFKKIYLCYNYMYSKRRSWHQCHFCWHVYPPIPSTSACKPTLQHGQDAYFSQYIFLSFFLDVIANLTNPFLRLFLFFQLSTRLEMTMYKTESPTFSSVTLSPNISSEQPIATSTPTILS